MRPAGGLAEGVTLPEPVFWVNIPVGAAAIILTEAYVPESRAAKDRRPGPFGQILVMTTPAG